MNASLLNKEIKCGKPNHKKQITIVINTCMKNYVEVRLHKCEHPDQNVVDNFNNTYKNAVLTANSMNKLKDKIFDLLQIEKHNSTWIDTMRIDGVTIRKLQHNSVVEPDVESTAEPTAEPTVESTVESTVEPDVEPTVEHTVEPFLASKEIMYYIYLIQGKDFAYVGLTTNFGNREKTHKRACTDNLNKNFKTQNSVQKLYTAINNNGGWEAVEMKILEIFKTDKNEVARKKEQDTINKFTYENPEIAILNRATSQREFIKCSEACCESKTRRMCSDCNAINICKKHGTCSPCKEMKMLREQYYSNDVNRERARNAYRIKHGIPLDAPLIQRGGARNVKYHTEEQKAERRIMDREYQREYQKKYRSIKLHEREIMEIVEKTIIESPTYMMTLLLESLKNKKMEKSYSDVE
jgi:predicted GIY-YIG superfamily endonuclease